MKIIRVDENFFKAVDADENEIGTCRITRRYMPRVFADCPVQISIEVKCQPEAEELLYSAGMARGKEIKQNEKLPVRVYVRVPATDTDTVRRLRDLGLQCRDGLVRMTREVTDEKIKGTPLAGCTIIRDSLENPKEFQNCLTRYNDCFGTKHSEAWLNSFIARDGFIRIVMVSQSGLCGELLAWFNGYTGVIGVVQTGRNVRRRGVASYLIEDARKYFAYNKLKRIEGDVWLAAPDNYNLAVQAGFSNQKVLYYYMELV